MDLQRVVRHTPCVTWIQTVDRPCESAAKTQGLQQFSSKCGINHLHGIVMTNYLLFFGEYNKSDCIEVEWVGLVYDYEHY